MRETLTSVSKKMEKLMNDESIKIMAIELLYVIFMAFGVFFSFPDYGDKLKAISWGILVFTMLMLYMSRLDLLIEIRKLRETIGKRK